MSISLFYFVAFLSIFFALLVIFAKNPVHSVLYLIVTFFTFTIHYILLNAQFLAIVNFIVYMGAIMVLFLFVLMLLNLDKDSEPKTHILVKIASVVAGGILFTVLIAALKDGIALGEMATATSQNNEGLVQNLGQLLFSKYVLPFEVSSVLFIASMVGAVLLAKREKQVID